MVRVLAVTAVVSLALGACATTKGTATFQVGEARGVKYVIPSELAGGLDDASLARKYADAARKATALRLEERNTANDTRGVRVVPVAGAVEVSYLHSASPSLYHAIVGRFGIGVSRQQAATVLDVSCPTQGRVDTAGPGGMPFSAFVEPDRAAADLRLVCSRAALTFTSREKGEVDVPFGEASVYANFKRKLPEAASPRFESTPNDVAKLAWYSIKSGEKSIPVGIAVYPYRSGSKVTYTWVDSTTCRPNSTCDFDPSAGKRVRDAIVAVAND